MLDKNGTPIPIKLFDMAVGPVSPQYTPVPVGIKFDGDKIKFSLLPWRELKEVIRVLMYGEKKYTQVLNGVEVSGADNWKMVPDKRKRYFNAAMRHLTTWYDGERFDPETNLPHLAHCICCLLFLLWDDNENKVA